MTFELGQELNMWPFRTNRFSFARRYTLKHSNL